MSEVVKKNGSGKVSLGNKLAFATGDIFGGGTFNIINFLFVPFLTLVVGIPMIWASPLLLVSKIWDGLVDPFIGKITDGKQPGRFGKRRYFMLIAAPIVFVGLILLFFPWNLVTDSVPLKVVLVIFVYILYATAQSFVLIPYYSLASEMTDDFTERNRTNAVRLAFSLTSSIICVSVPGMMASPNGTSLTESLGVDASVGYIIMSCVFGFIFCVAILVTALFAREQIIMPAVKRKISFKEFVKPLKVKTYRRYLGMQMCTSMGMAIMSSFFFVFCDFVLRRDTYFVASGQGLSRFPVGTIAASLMFVSQIIALPFYLKMIKLRSKSFAYILSGIIWITMCLVVLCVPAEGVGTAQVTDGFVSTITGTPDWAIILLGLGLGFGLGGCTFIPHSSFGDVCDVGQLYYGERTEGAFSGLTNFLNTTAQAIGLALPPLIMGIRSLGGYVETQYISLEEYQLYVDGVLNAVEGLGLELNQFAITVGEANVKLVPLLQTEGAQLALRLTFTLLPMLVAGLGMFFASRYRLTAQRQKRIVELLEQDPTTEAYKQKRIELLTELQEKLPPELQQPTDTDNTDSTSTPQ